MKTTPTIEEFKAVYSQLSPINKLKTEKKALELLDKEGKLTAANLEDFAKDYQLRSSFISMSYDDLAMFGDFFTVYGQKYGLLETFRENGITDYMPDCYAIRNDRTGQIVEHADTRAEAETIRDQYDVMGAEGNAANNEYFGTYTVERV